MGDDGAALDVVELQHQHKNLTYLSKKVPYHISRIRNGFDQAQPSGTELFWRVIQQANKGFRAYTEQSVVSHLRVERVDSLV